MNDYLKKIAFKYRNAIEKAKKQNLLNGTILQNFPRGCCGDTCDLIAQDLLERNIKCKIINGTYYGNELEDKYSHSWIEVNDSLIIDITADQFIGNPLFESRILVSCYVGAKNEFYEKFDINNNFNSKKYFEGIDRYGNFARENLKKVRIIILKIIDDKEKSDIN